MEVIARILRWLEVPRNELDARVRALRQETETTDRAPHAPQGVIAALRGLGELEIESLRVEPGSAAVASSALSLRIRSETGALMVGVRRGEALLERPDPSAPFEVGDVVYFVGKLDALERVQALFAPRSAAG